MPSVDASVIVQTVQSTFVLKVLSLHKTLKGGLEEERGKEKGVWTRFFGECVSSSSSIFVARAMPRLPVGDELIGGQRRR